MSAPKCKICTKQHYGQCDPKDLPDLPQQSSSVKKAEPIANDSQVESSLSETSLTVKQQETQAKREWRKRNRDHYNEYMREYMKRRRKAI